MRHYAGNDFKREPPYGGSVSFKMTPLFDGPVVNPNAPVRPCRSTAQNRLQPSGGRTCWKILSRADQKEFARAISRFRSSILFAASLLVRFSANSLGW